MDFKELLTKMTDLDADQTNTVNENDAMLPTMPQATEPTMSVNMNAQGDSIKDLLHILSKLNNDVVGLDNDGDGDHDLSDHEMEAYANEPDEEIKDIDYMVNKLAGGMNKPKDTYDVVSKGDNPMQKTHKDMVEHFRKQLETKLREYKEK